MKAHYDVLDGLRGTAALAIILFHILEMLFPADQAPMQHAFLAADFFFALSGFVVGYAYEERLKAGMGFLDFAKRRLIRLHPVVIIAASWGLVGWLIDPYVGDKQTVGVAISVSQLVLIFALSLFLLPTPTLPNEFGETHSINGPSWTLFQEYLANILYGLFGWRMGKKTHIALCLASAAGLAWTANKLGWLGCGWQWEYFWVAPIRMACPFLIGLLVYRQGWRIPLPQSWLILSAVLIAVLSVPKMGSLNGLFEAGCVIFIFPLILAAGAGTEKSASGVLGRLCRFTGKLSYPVYIIHYPLIYIFGHWVWSASPPRPLLIGVAAALYLVEIGLGTLLLYAYDQPVRAWLSRKFLARST
jgi:Predicted acyltransferases